MSLLDYFRGRKAERRNGDHHRSQAPAVTSGSQPGINQILGAGTATYFDALRATADRTKLVRFSGSNLLASGSERMQLSAIGRALYDNGGWVGYAIEQTAIYCTPVWIQPNTLSNDWNNAAEAYFRDWSRRCDFFRRDNLDFGGLQSLACQAIDVDGDMGCAAVEVDGEVVLKMVDGFNIGTPEGPRKDVIDGIKVDSQLRALGYYVARPNPDLASILWPYYGGPGYDFYDINQMTLLKDTRLTEPYRGLSPLRRGANHVRDGNDILGYAKLAWKDYASIRGVVEGGYLDEEHGFDLTGDETNPPPDATAGEKTLGRWDMLGGDVPVLPPGKVFKRVSENPPSSEVAPFLDSLASLFSAGLLIPPAFFLDSKLTGPNVRGVNGKAQRRFTQRRQRMAALARWVWVRVIGHAITTGRLPAQDGWDRKFSYQFPPDVSIDAGDDSQADREDVAVGSKSRQEVVGKRGQDWQRVTDQVMAEDDYIIERCKEQSKRTGVPLEVLLQRHGLMAKPPPPPSSDNSKPPPPPAKKSQE